MPNGYGHRNRSRRTETSAQPQSGLRSFSIILSHAGNIMRQVRVSNQRSPNALDLIDVLDAGLVATVVSIAGTESRSFIDPARRSLHAA